MRPGRAAGRVRARGRCCSRTSPRRAGVEAVRRDFVANVSHELKTPVGALALLAEALAGRRRRPGGGAARSPSGCSTRPTRLGRLVQRAHRPVPAAGRRAAARAGAGRGRRGGRRGGRPHPSPPRPSGIDRGRRRRARAGRPRQREPARHRACATCSTTPSPTARRAPGSRSPPAPRTGHRRDRGDRPGHRHRRARTSSGSSSASTGSTRRARAAPAAPASAWPSSSTSPPTTAARSTVWSVEGLGSTFTLRLPAVRPTTPADAPPTRPAGRPASTRRSDAKGDRRDPRAGRRGRGVVLRRAVLHAAQGGLRGRRRGDRPGRRSPSSTATAPTSCCST